MLSEWQPKSMDLNSASYFLKVVQLGSFTKAADSLGIPKSTLSEKITELEHALKITLMIRTTRKLTLTDAGKLFYKKIQPALEEIAHAHTEAMDSQQEVSGEIRMSVIADFADSLFIDMLAEFRRKFPGVTLDAHFDNREVDIVGEGYDLAIRGGKMNDSALISRHVGYSKFVLVVGKKYESELGLPKSPKDIELHTCLKMSPFHADSKWELQNGSGNRVTVSTGKIPGCNANSMTALKNMAEKSLGIALIPLFLCKSEIERGTLIRILPQWHMGPMSVHLVYPKVQFASARMKIFLPFLEERLKSSIV